MTSGIDDREVLPSIDGAAAVAESCTQLMRSFAKIRTQVLALARHDVEWSAQLLITKLAVEGPIRSSALAELVQSDPSTVSRQVAALVKAGYVERRADPIDGRASLLVVTARGEQIYEEHRQLRNEHYQHTLAEWTDAECLSFAAMMSRFTDDIDKARPSWFSGESAASSVRRRLT
jgi:DNA-binding MarR family transcriptional regulator